MEKVKTPPKPVVVIRKGSLYKAKTVPVILNKLIKRKNPNVSVEDNPSAKRLCHDNETAIKQENVDDEISDIEEIESEPEEIVITKKKNKTILGRQSGGVCLKHDEPLLEHRAAGLPQPGDVFSSINDFTDYITSNAKTWLFYYVRSETRLNKPHGTCVYRCKFFRKQSRSQGSGVRSHRNKPTSLACPASVHLKRQPKTGEMKVTLVCHHHTHELSKEDFDQQPHGYRLPQDLKDEIRDLALLNVHPALIRKYVESKVPDLNLGKTVINTVIKLRHEKITKDILSPQRLSDMLKKIRYIKANFDISLMSSNRKITPVKRKTIMVKKADTTMTPEVKTTPEKKFKLEGSEYENSDETMNSVVIEKLEFDSLNETDDDVDQNTTVDTENEEYGTTYYTSDGEPVELDADNNPILINKPTGNYEYSDNSERLLINPETGLLDTNVESSEDPEVFIKQYKIGDISIVCTESVDDTGATVVLNHISNSRGSLTENSVLKTLTKVEKSICEPKSFSPKTEGKKKVTKKEKGDPVEEARAKCRAKHGDLPEQEAEGLIEVGSTFSSIDELLSYAASCASQWYFYYHVFDSRNTKGADKSKPILYNLHCRFNKGFYKSKSKGLRKVKQNNINCPAGLHLRCAPGEDRFTVTHACHHHSHELSAELFGKEAHGHRLPQELKDEIKVLAWYKLDPRLIKQYLEDITGLNMGKTIKNIVAAMKRKNVKVEVPPEKMTEILDKIKDIKQRFQTPKRAPAIPKKRRKRVKEAETTDSEKEDAGENKSRVETRLNNILYDQELIQSVKELQENTGCEIELNPWGGVNVYNEGVNLQEGVVVESEYNEAEDNEQTECQIKIDHEVYNMDENVQYIIPNQGNILGVEFTGEGEKVVYIDENDANMPEVHNTIEYDDTVMYEEEGEVADEVVCGETYDAPDIKQEAQTHTEGTQEYRQVEYDFTDDENEYQMMYQYTNDEEHENDEQTYKDNYYECRDMGVQADLPVIELEREYEKIRKLEAAVAEEDIGQSKYSHSSRSQPKVIIEEAIINRFNIEFYINQCGVSPCLENLAFNMGITVLGLLKQLYQGEAVFKMTLGRSGRQNRKTVHLAHIPLTIAFPYEKFKYIHCLQEYKSICAKYSDVAMQLENTIQSISKNLETKEAELDEFKTKNHDYSQLNENHEKLLKNNEELKESLKQTKTELTELRKQNGLLTKKVKHYESLNISSRIKDAEILKQLLKPQEQNDNLKVAKENRTLKNKIHQLTSELEELSQAINNDNIVTERMKQLESSLVAANADNANYKTKIRKIEQLYLTDSQSLLDKISGLETQIEKYKAASNDNFTENASSLKLLANAELKCRRLEKQLKDLQESRSSDKVNNKSNMDEETPTEKRVYGTRSKQKN